ncbi:hypothetical protein AHAS_Ahas13G0434200 [Arachis hypogaea]
MYTMTNFIVFDHKYKEKNGVSRMVLIFSQRTLVNHVKKPSFPLEDFCLKNGVSRMVLTFFQRTLVNHVKKPSFPLEAFCLKSYVDLLIADKLPDSEMFDLIGEVICKEDPRDLITSKGKETKRLVIILQDLENNRINCILFGDLVDHLLPHLEEERAEPLIVVLQYFKAIRWNGKTSVQSNFEISKVHINPELTEIIQFKSKLCSPAASNSTRISQVSSPNAWSALDELKHRSVAIKTIEEALNSMEGVGEDDYPQSLDNIMDKRVLFKLNVKSANIKQYDPVYTVMKICDDEDIIMKNMPESLPNKLAANEDGLSILRTMTTATWLIFRYCGQSYE